MAGTKAGGKRAAATNKQLYGEDFYVRIGQRGGSNLTGPKGFALDRERASKAGRLGGMVGKRGRWQDPEEKAKLREEIRKREGLYFG